MSKNIPTKEEAEILVKELCEKYYTTFNLDHYDDIPTNKKREDFKRLIKHQFIEKAFPEINEEISNYMKKIK